MLIIPIRQEISLSLNKVFFCLPYAVRIISNSSIAQNTKKCQLKKFLKKVLTKLSTNDNMSLT